MEVVQNLIPEIDKLFALIRANSSLLNGSGQRLISDNDETPFIINGSINSINTLLFYSVC
jgi:hypothetical protein